MLLMRTSSFRIRRAPWTLSSRFIPFSLAKVSSKPFSASSKVCCYSKTNTYVAYNNDMGFPLANTKCTEERHFFKNKKWDLPRYSGMSYFVPLWLLHFLSLPLCGEDERGSQCRYSPFSDGLLGVPYCVEDVVKKGLHLLKEESWCAHSKLPQHQHLEKTEDSFMVDHELLFLGSLLYWQPFSPLLKLIKHQ